MNLRDIKKDIEYVIGAFIDDCSLFSSANSHADDEVLGGLLDEAVNLYNDLRDKVNVKMPGKKAAYYVSLRKELLEETDVLYQKLSVVVKDALEAEKNAPVAKVVTKKAAADAEKPAAKKAAEAEKPAAEKKPAAKKAPAKKAAETEKPVAEKKPAAKKSTAKKPAAKKAAPEAEKKEEEK